MTTRKVPGTRLLCLVLGLLLLAAACRRKAEEPAPAPEVTAQFIAPEEPATISVTGLGQALGSPDLVYVQLGVDLTDAAAAEVVTAGATRMDDVMAALRGIGITEEQVQTVRYGLWPEEEYDRQGRPTGGTIYHVVSQIRVTVRDPNLVSQVLSSTLAAGANSVGGVSFAIADPTPLEEEARAAAVADARARAEALAEELGLTLGDPVSVSETTSGPVTAPGAPLGGGAEGALPPISGGEFAVTVQVEIVFAVEAEE